MKPKLPIGCRHSFITQVSYFDIDSKQLRRIKYIVGRTRAHINELGLLYAVQLLFGLIIGVVLCSIINTYLGQSATLDQLALGFDRTVIMDMIYNNENALYPVLYTSAFLIPIYFILSILLQGGILSNIKLGATGIRSQVKSGAKNFVPFVGIVILSSVFIAIIAAIVGFPFIKLVGDPLLTFSSEKPFVWWLIALMVLFSLVLILVWGWSVSTRYAYIDDPQFLKSLQIGFGFVKRNFSKLIAVGYLCVAIHLVLGLIYFLIMGDRGAPSYLLVLFGIIVQQVFAILRVMIRGFGYIALEQMDDDY